MLKTSITFDKNIEHFEFLLCFICCNLFLHEKINCYNNLFRIQLYRERCVQYINVQYYL